MSEPTCSIDADCEPGYICLGGRCVPDPVLNPPMSQLPGLGRFLRKRYTCNIPITEEMTGIDLLTDVIFKSSRLYLTQSASGKLSIRNKKPVPWALGTDALSVSDDALAVDSVAEWIGDVDNWLLISPHTNKSEIRRVAAAVYSTSQNSVGFSSTGGLFTITGFSGCDGDSTPATANIVVDSATADTDFSITLDGVEFTGRTSSAGETVVSIAAYIAGMISSHPSLYRRFAVTYAAGDDTVYISPRFGELTLDSGVTFAKDAPLADPATGPTLGSSAGDLAAGSYVVAYSCINAAGETLISPFETITLSASKQIDVTTVTLPTGVTSLKWYCSPEADSVKLRYVAENDGTGFSIDVLPKLTAPLPPDLNRTGYEVMRVAAVFSDRETTRSSISRSNVIRATFKWSLAGRDKTTNAVYLKYRDASQDFRLVELRLRDDANIAKVKTTKKVEINGQAIDNTDQAYRIAAGELAEKQDADFFYSWKATREALLLQEGDVCAITDNGSGVYNFPVMIENIDFDLSSAGLPTAQFTARKYASTLYDDSVVERNIPVVSEIS